MKTAHPARPVVIRPGNLDIHTAPDFLATLGQIAWADAAIVVIDLGDTEFFDEAGIEMIITAAEQAAADHCRFGVVCTWWPILRMLRAAGLTETMDVSASISELTMPPGTRPGPRYGPGPHLATGHRDTAS
jgi:anti-anti-sigma factor